MAAAVDAVVLALWPEQAAPSNTIATHTARRLAATHPVSRACETEGESATRCQCRRLCVGSPCLRPSGVNAMRGVPETCFLGELASSASCWRRWRSRRRPVLRRVLHWCSAHDPNYVEDVFERSYTAGVPATTRPSSTDLERAGSARNLTWTMCCRRTARSGGLDRVRLLDRRHVNDASSLLAGVEELSSTDTIARAASRRRRDRALRAQRLHHLLAGVVDQAGRGWKLHGAAVFNGILGRPGHRW